MNKITRYNPAHVMGMATTPYVAPMIPSTSGKYVKHESHQQQMDALQRELDALKQMQKDDFFYHLRIALNGIAEKAIKDAVTEVVRLQTQTVYTVDPAHCLTAKMVDEMVTRINSEPAQSVLTGGIVKSGAVFVGDAFIHSRTITADRIKTEESQAGTCIKCVKSDVDYFTQGKSYDVEVRGDVVYVAQDNHVSDLNEHDQWKTNDFGAYLAITSPNGEPCVIFGKLGK